jgi:hypothetical protein
MSERVYKSSQAARDKAAAWYLANKERAAAKNAAYRVEIRRLSNEAKSQPCERCGGSFPIYVMEFHHRDPSEKKCEIANAPTPNLARKELAKCDVLCANCHRIVEHESDR